MTTPQFRVRKLTRWAASALLSAGIALFHTPGTSYADVVATLSSESGEVRDVVAVNASTAFAATQGGGLRKTTNNGATWSPVDLGPEGPRFVWTIAVSPNAQVIYVASATGLYKSANGGANWIRLSHDAIRTVTIDTSGGDATGSRLLIGVPGVGILRSTDSGATFFDVSAGLDSSDVRAVVVDSSGNAYAALFGSTSGGWGGVFKLSSGASSWASWNTAGGGSAIDNKFVTSLAISNTVLIAGTMDPASGDGRVHRSVLSGPPGWSNPTMEATGYLFGVESLAQDRSGIAGGNAFYAGTRALGIYRSQDGGLTWVRQGDVASNPEVSANAYAIGSYPSVTAVNVGAKGAGVFYTANASGAGTTWTRATGIKADRVRSLASGATAGTLYMGLEGGGVTVSTNGGATWAPLNNGLPKPNGASTGLYSVNALAAHPTNPAVVYAGLRGPGLFRLTGTTWGTMSCGPSQCTGGDQPQDLQFDASGNLYYSLFDLNQGFYLYNGSWTLFEPGVWSGAGSARLYQGSAALFAMMHDSLPLRSTTGPLGSFAPVTVPNVPGIDTGFMRLAFNSITQNPLSSVLVAATNKGIYRSSNAGANWTRVALLGPASMHTALSAVAYTVGGAPSLFAADRGGGVYCSMNDGDNWSAVGMPLGAPVLDLKFMNGQIHALTDGAGIATFATSCP